MAKKTTGSRRRSPVTMVGGLAMLAGVFVTALGIVAPAASAAIDGEFLGFDHSAPIVMAKPNGDIIGNTTGTRKLLAHTNSGDSIYSAYCIDFETSLLLNTPYTEADWSQANVATDLASINWILHHSYPVVGLAALGVAAGIPESAPGVPGISADEAAAATQVAIWRYSDGAGLSSAGNTSAVDKLYAYLTGPANVGLASQPTTQLTLAPPSASGVAGGSVGPFTVGTSASSLLDIAVTSGPPTLSLAINGGAGSKVKDGDTFTVVVPAGEPSGSGTVTVSGSSIFDTGRVWVLKSDPKSAQKMIVAASGPLTVSGSVGVSWTGSVPEASTSENCAQGGVDVLLTNSSSASSDAVFNVTEPGSGFSQGPFTVAPGASQTVFVPLTTGTSYDIAVTTGSWVKHLTGTHTCTAPSTSSTAPSTTEPSTTAPSTTEPSTTAPSTTEPSTTAPSTTEPSTTETTPDPTTSTLPPSTVVPSTTVLVGESTTTSTTKRTEVAGIVVLPVAPLRPATLPRTGSDTAPLVLIGSVFLGVGLIVLLLQGAVTRRKNPA